MAEKFEVTQKEALGAAIAAVEDEKAKAVLQHMLDMKNKPRVKRENKEAIAFREELVKTLRGIDGPRKAGEIAELVNDKPQRVANNLKILVEEGRVQKFPGEKAKDAATYQIA